MQLSAANHAFISGGASGIGLGIGDALAKRGVRVTLADVNAEALAAVLCARGGQFQGVALDVRNREQWQAAKAQAEAAFGPVDVVINNAGIAPDGCEFADSLPESFERIIGINLMGVYNGVHCFAAQLRAAGGGYILNMASMAGISVPPPGTGAYTTSKFAIVGLTEALRDEMAAHGVGVSVMCPGLVTTDLAANTARIGGMVRALTRAMPPGLDAAVAGEMAVRGIERGNFYILTAFGRDEPVRRRFEEQLAAFAAGPDADIV